MFSEQVDFKSERVENLLIAFDEPAVGTGELQRDRDQQFLGERFPVPLQELFVQNPFVCGVLVDQYQSLFHGGDDIGIFQETEHMKSFSSGKTAGGIPGRLRLFRGLIRFLRFRRTYRINRFEQIRH